MFSAISLLGLMRLVRHSKNTNATMQHVQYILKQNSQAM